MIRSYRRLTPENERQNYMFKVENEEDKLPFQKLDALGESPSLISVLHENPMTVTRLLLQACCSLCHGNASL